MPPWPLCPDDPRPLPLTQLPAVPPCASGFVPAFLAEFVRALVSPCGSLALAWRPPRRGPMRVSC